MLINNVSFKSQTENIKGLINKSVNPNNSVANIQDSGDKVELATVKQNKESKKSPIKTIIAGATAVLAVAGIAVYLIKGRAKEASKIVKETTEPVVKEVIDEADNRISSFISRLYQDSGEDFIKELGEDFNRLAKFSDNDEKLKFVEIMEDFEKQGVDKRLLEIIIESSDKNLIFKLNKLKGIPLNNVEIKHKALFLYNTRSLSNYDYLEKIATVEPDKQLNILNKAYEICTDENKIKLLKEQVMKELKDDTNNVFGKFDPEFEFTKENLNRKFIIKTIGDKVVKPEDKSKSWNELIDAYPDTFDGFRLGRDVIEPMEKETERIMNYIDKNAYRGIATEFEEYLKNITL